MEPLSTADTRSWYTPNGFGHLGLGHSRFLPHLGQVLGPDLELFGAR